MLVSSLTCYGSSPKPIKVNYDLSTDFCVFCLTSLGQNTTIVSHMNIFCPTSNENVLNSWDDSWDQNGNQGKSEESAMNVVIITI